MKFFRDGRTKFLKHARGNIDSRLQYRDETRITIILGLAFLADSLIKECTKKME